MNIWGKKSITVCVPLYNEEDVVDQLSNKHTKYLIR